MTRPETVDDLLRGGTDGSTAIRAPGRLPLTYKGLRAVVEDTVSALASFGLGPNDRVAMVLENGPEMAVAFLGIAARATPAPLNPPYRVHEFSLFLPPLPAQLLVFARDTPSP